MKTIRFLIIIFIAILLNNGFSSCNSSDEERVRTIEINASIWPEYESHELLGYDYVGEKLINSWDYNDRILVYDNDNSNQPYIAILKPTEINGNIATLKGSLLSEPKGNVRLIRITKSDFHKYDTPKNFQQEYSLSVETNPDDIIQYWFAKNVALTQNEDRYEANANMSPLSGILKIIAHENSIGEIAFNGDVSRWQTFTFPQGISYISFESRTRFIFKFSDGRLLDVEIRAGTVCVIDL